MVSGLRYSNKRDIRIYIHKYIYLQGTTYDESENSTKTHVNMLRKFILRFVQVGPL